MARQARPIKLKSGNYQVKWDDHTGKRRSATFPTHNLARAGLAKRQADTAAVRSGLAAAPPPRKTFDDLAAAWPTVTADKRSAKFDASRLRVHLMPTFKGVALTDINDERIIAFSAALRALSPQTKKHVLVLLSAMLKHAHRIGWIHRVPLIDMPRIGGMDRNFCYLRTFDEVRRFLAAALEDDEKCYVLYATAVLTGMRQGELAALTWDRVDLDRQLITVDRSFTGPTKSGKVRWVPIVDELLPVLRQWRLKCPLPIVFPNQKGEMHHPKDRVFAEQFHRVLDRAGFERPKGRQRHYVRFHDLRHTFASHFAMRGGDMFRLQKILGHGSIDQTMRYAHLTPEAFAADRGRFSGMVPVGNGLGGEVVELRRKQRG